MGTERGLGPKNQKILDQALKTIREFDGWATTVEIADEINHPNPRQVGALLRWAAKRDKTLKHKKINARLTRWRLAPDSSVEPPTRTTEPAENEYPDDIVIRGLAHALGEKEQFRQALLRIRQNIDEILGKE